MIHAPTERNKAMDLVCGMEVEASSPHKTTHQGETFYFCSQSCLDRFTGDPKKYIGER